MTNSEEELMALIPHNYTRGHGRRDPNTAMMSTIANGAYVHLFSGVAAKRLLDDWSENGGISLVWETDDATGMPVKIRLTQATGGGLELKPRRAPAYLEISTSLFGRAVVAAPRPVEETINDDGSITVTVPFEFEGR
jgi:hypothetical protein